MKPQSVRHRPVRPQLRPLKTSAEKNGVEDEAEEQIAEEQESEVEFVLEPEVEMETIEVHRVPKIKRAPEAPSREDRRTHGYPFQPRCPHCVGGRSQHDPHVVQEAEEDNIIEKREAPTIGIYVWFMSKVEVETGQKPLTMMADEQNQRHMPYAMESMPMGDWIVKGYCAWNI